MVATCVNAHCKWTLCGTGRDCDSEHSGAYPNTLSTSHTRALLSADPVASKHPLASTAMSATGASWDFQLRETSPEATSHLFVCRLRLAVKSVRALGVNASAVIGSESPANVFRTLPLLNCTSFTSSPHAQATASPPEVSESGPPV
eukprot:345516-Prorocentrum_minimum.AAC.2